MEPGTEERVREAMMTNRPVEKKRAARMPSAVKAVTTTSLR